MVSRPAQVRQRAPWGFWNGHRARRGVDLRAGARARDDSVSPNAESAVPVTSFTAEDAESAENGTNKLDMTTNIASSTNISPKKIRVIGVPLDLGQARRGVAMGPSAVPVSGREGGRGRLG